jgi:hypothetical protein
MFVNLLRYKQMHLGGELLLVNPQYTSQQCLKCLRIDAKIDYLNQGLHVSIANNILAAGLAVMACQANSIKSRQQEPVGNRKVVLP